MFKYLMKRMGLMLITFVITVFLVFLFIKLMPDNYISPPMSGDDWYEINKIREGWDKPIIVQFAYWVRNIFVDGSFGFSSILRRDVASVYFGKIPATVYINIIPYLLSVPIAIGLGILAALNKNKLPDTIISIAIMIFISVPFFVTAILSQYIFYFKLGWAPSLFIATSSEFVEKGFLYGISTYILPVTILTLTSVPGFARSVRAELTEQLTQDYMLLARSKGLTKRQATFRHALKNAMVPFLPSIFIGIIGVISGGMITEKIFRVDGTGRLYLQAFNGRDYALLMLITVFGQFIGLVSSIVGDISYTLVDPRVRVGSGKLS